MLNVIKIKGLIYIWSSFSLCLFNLVLFWFCIQLGHHFCQFWWMLFFLLRVVKYLTLVNCACHVLTPFFMFFIIVIFIIIIIIIICIF